MVHFKLPRRLYLRLRAQAARLQKSIPETGLAVLVPILELLPPADVPGRQLEDSEVGD